MPLYLHLKELFGTGSLYKDKTLYKGELNNVCKYRISEKNKLIEVINLINGKFRTPKIKCLHKAIDYINEVHKVNIEKFPLDTSNILSNP